MKKLFYLLFMVVSCTSQNCKSFPDTFSSYNEVISTIQKTTFRIEDSINTSKSSWIKKANYYSCDEVKGFFVLKTDSKNYVFGDVPIEIWKMFKKADSFGEFYNANIRNKYHLYYD